ncbi:MAG: DHHA1 domain-containing protein, partial [Christensenellaceae bacterium]
ALTIMHYALRAYGIEPVLYIPERKDGYGLNIDAIDRIFDEVMPELFITVDCGISNAAEVRYAKECGAEVIVTDHHELPPVLPDCVCINPKIKDDYPYDNLCGAGVAFKLACALLGEKAYELADFAALATVADSVPLLGENRDIVTEGLLRINRSPRPCFSALIGKNTQEVTAQTLAFTLAPRINAAGRMGDARAALELFISEEEEDVYRLANKLTDYNVARQRSCDELYNQAKALLREKGAYKNIIMLADERWNNGFIGIVAARLAEEYNRPTILFVKSGDKLKGSARSIESINIFEALRASSELITEFGGHAQAAGVNVTEEQFPLLEEALDRYIGERYQPEDFVSKLPIAAEIREKFSVEFARELALMEPFGVGNRRPLFCVTAAECDVRPIKPQSSHLCLRLDEIELLYFSGAKYLRLLESDVHKRIVFECNLSEYRGRQYVKGFVREIVYDGRSGQDVELDLFANTLSRLRLRRVDVKPEYLGDEEIRQRIDDCRRECAYGTCVVASRRETFVQYPEYRGRVDLLRPSDKNTTNRLLTSPADDADLSGYRNVFFLDMPLDFNVSALKGKTVYVNPNVKGFSVPKGVRTDRESLLAVYAALRTNTTKLVGTCNEEITRYSQALGFDRYQFIFALTVFEELGLIVYENDRLVVRQGVKVNLNDSVVYRKLCAYER